MQKRLLHFFIPILVLGLAFTSMLIINACDAPVSSDFLEGNEVDPNNPTQVTVDQLFTGVQINGYRQHSGHLARTVAMWMQQMAGTDRQYQQYDRYIFSEDDYDGEFDNWYTGGGLIDIRRIIKLANEQLNDRVYAGYGKFYEAWFIGTCASLWGDTPYSQAVNDQFPTPKLDKQADVYAAVQALLDQAIADLGSGVGLGPRTVDLGYRGNVQRMVAAARTLKARYYMHWAESDPSNYQKALNETNQGISAVASNLMTVHNASVSTEWSMWYQFYQSRDSYTRAGKFMVDLMKARNDPRLNIYYRPLASGQVVGAAIGEPVSSTTSLLGTAFSSQASAFPLITYEENELIKAECNFKTSQEAAALQNLNNVRAAVAAKWSVAYPALTGLSGQALLDEILTEKYLSLFLQIEVWNDYKRNCFPRLQTYQGQPIPGRLLYSDDERNANPNFPVPAAQPQRNTNDPGQCN
ncbi:MAG: SusD/RagB family nutrient-binding outer membrane lipoprotein [bacterium]